MDDSRSPKHRPLVTFALFAYNQAEYIREALEGALSQTYEPLEVIVSDDCSTDRTYALIQEVAGDYRGPHKVVVRRTSRNSGILSHVVEVAKEAQGHLIVLAAGDDVSKPERTEKLVESWLATGAWGLHSRFDRIDRSGRVIEFATQSGYLMSPNYRLRQYFYEDQGCVPIVHGSTSAYDSELFRLFRLAPEDYILSEDGALSVLINLVGKRIEMLTDALVCYREHSGSVTNAIRVRPITLASIRGDEATIERLAASQANRCRFFLRLWDELGSMKARDLRIDQIEKDRYVQDVRASWYSLHFLERLQFLLSDPGRKNRAWALPRMFGERVFVAIKYLAKTLNDRKRVG